MDRILPVLPESVEWQFFLVQLTNSKQRVQLLYRAIWPLGVMATILWSSATQSPEVPSALVFPHVDKVVHFLFFGLIATLLYRTLAVRPVHPAAMLLAFLLTSLFGIGDEALQSLNAHRDVEPADWVADTAGAGISVLVYAFWPRYRILLETPLVPRKKRSHGG